MILQSALGRNLSGLFGILFGKTFASLDKPYQLGVNELFGWRMGGGGGLALVPHSLWVYPVVSTPLYLQGVKMQAFEATGLLETVYLIC